MMNAISPGPYLFWSLAGGPILLAGWRQVPANGIGFLVGFYGAMGGTLLLYILILWFGQTFLESAGTQKIAAMMMNAMAAIVFGLNDAVSYYLAVSLFCGCFIGSYIGAHYSDRIGNVWIRRLFIILLVILIIKLLI